jgi:hypothetical protein
MPKVLENITQINNSYEKYALNAHCCQDQNTHSVRTFPLLLDKLAQPPTDPRKTFEKRARSKYLSRALVLELTKLDSPLKKSYWNTWHCTNVLHQEGKKITAKYCNNRWCLVCNRIRTAKLIKGYLPEIKKMSDPQFVTLTIPNMPASELKDAIDGMIREFILIKNVFVRRRGLKIVGIRKLECTFNNKAGEYHPHIHLIVDGIEIGKALIEEWLHRYPDADKRGQNIRPADENSMIELFKYSTKLTTKSLITKENGKTIIQVNAIALDVIFQAMYNRRIFQSMGLVKQVSEDIEEIDAQIFEDLKEVKEDFWRWEQEVSDWINSDGEMLTGCEAYKKYEVRFDTG